MKASFKLDDSELKNLEASMTITMPLKTWASLREGLDQFKWPQSDLSELISALINKAYEEFHAEGKRD